MEDDLGRAVAADVDGNVVVSGYTSGSLGGPNRGSNDAFVAKYSAAGDRLWRRQPGTTEPEWSTGVATDADGNVVITGFTYGSLGGANQGLNDAFIVKYSAAGDRLWKRQLGTAEYDWSNGVATDGEGNIVIGGWTNGALGGRNRGDDDAFVAKFRP